MKPFFLSLFISTGFFTSSAQVISIKSWQGISKYINKPASAMEAALKQEGYQKFAQQERDDNVFISNRDSASSKKYAHPKIGATVDVYIYIVRNEKVEGFGFSFLPLRGTSFLPTAYKEYESFKRSILENKFKEFGLLERERKEIRFYKNDHAGLTIRLEKMLSGDTVEGVNVFIYHDDLNLNGDDEAESIEYLKANPDKAGKF